MTKLDDLIQWFVGKGSALVALSGGVDSALVAYAAYQSLRTSSVAITADYKTLAQEELDSARRICQEIGIRHIVIQYNELENRDFVKNDKNRCFYCRAELSEYLKKIAIKENFSLVADGTHLDDLGEYRPGIKALKENGIKSPLIEVGFIKEEIRKEAKRVGLSVYDRPSNSCLASRIPWGQRITAERLARIESCEIMIKQLFGIRQVRVRDLGEIAKIEVGSDEIKLLSDKTKLALLDSHVKRNGFQSMIVDPDGYRPGKLNVITD